MSYTSSYRVFSLKYPHKIIYWTSKLQFVTKVVFLNPHSIIICPMIKDRWIKRWADSFREVVYILVGSKDFITVHVHLYMYFILYMYIQSMPGFVIGSVPLIFVLYYFYLCIHFQYVMIIHRLEFTLNTNHYQIRKMSLQC